MVTYHLPVITIYNNWGMDMVGSNLFKTDVIKNEIKL